MVKPERRTKADLIAAAAIVVVVAVGAALIWWNSDARATVSRPASTSGTLPSTMRLASPSAIAVLPTPGSPT